MSHGITNSNVGSLAAAEPLYSQPIKAAKEIGTLNNKNVHQAETPDVAKAVVAQSGRMETSMFKIFEDFDIAVLEKGPKYAMELLASDKSDVSSLDDKATISAPKSEIEDIAGRRKEVKSQLESIFAKPAEPKPELEDEDIFATQSKLNLDKESTSLPNIDERPVPPTPESSTRWSIKNFFSSVSSSLSALFSFLK